MTRSTLSALLLPFLFALPVAAETPPADCPPCPEPAAAEETPPPPPVWSGGLGLSLVVTSGNSDVRSFGLDAAVQRRPDPWGFEAGLMATRVEEDGRKSAERYLARARAERALAGPWFLFGGLALEQDELAGLDRRTLVESGATWRALDDPRQSLALDVGLTWTDERLVSGPDASAFGALAGLTYARKLGDTATFRERAVWYPSFEQGADWRLTSETALEAGLTARWALKLALLVRYDNRPAPGFEETDTTTTASLVWRL